MAKQIITELDIIQASKNGKKTLHVSPTEFIVTAQARDTSLQLGVTLVEDSTPIVSSPVELAISTGLTSNEDFSDSDTKNLVLKVVESIRGALPPGTDRAEVTRLVRNAVAARMGSPVSPMASVAVTTASGIIFVDSKALLEKSSKADTVKEKTLLAEAIGRPGESKLAAGYLVWERMTYDRIVEVPEIIVVIEGELHLKVNNQTTIAKPGDMVYLPEGVNVTLGALAKVKLACINGLV